MISIGMSGHVAGMEMGSTMQDVYALTWGHDAGNISRIKETSGEGAIGISMPGAANAIYGPALTQLAYNRLNAFAVFGQEPYRMGWRVETQHAVGRGSPAAVVRGGSVPTPKLPKYAQIAWPFKIAATSTALDLGMTEVGERGTDDVALWKDIIMNHGQGFLNNLNEQILGRVEDDPVTGVGGNDLADATAATQRVGFESLERIISNADEARYVPETYAIPWYATADNQIADTRSDMNVYRSQDSYDTLGFSDPRGLDDPMGGNVIHNYKEGTTDGEAEAFTTLSQNSISELYYDCVQWWEGHSSQGKAFIMGVDSLQKLTAQSSANQRFLNTEYVQFGVGGSKTVEGRDIGFPVSSAFGIPIIPEPMIGRGDSKDPTKGVGRVMLCDLDAIKRFTLRDMQIRVTDDPLIVGSYNRLGNMFFMGEMIAKKFKTSGKLIHVQ